MCTAVYGVAESRDEAEQIIERAREENFFKSDFSILFAGRSEAAAPLPAPAPHRAALFFPLLSPVFVSGPLAAGLGEESGLAAALMKAGVPEFEAHRYDGKIRKGGFLIVLHAEDDEETVLRARKILHLGGACGILTRCVESEPAGPFSEAVVLCAVAA